MGLAELTSAGGPQSLLTAFLDTLGSPTETVLTLWKRLTFCLPLGCVNGVFRLS